MNQSIAVVAVAEERSFTRAAARLHVVQSGVSAVIKSLERGSASPSRPDCRNGRMMRVSSVMLGV